MLGVAAQLAAACGVCQAQAPATGSGPAWPNKPVRMLVGFPPGGPTDVVARIVSEKLMGQIGQRIVIDNRPGAAGNIAVEILTKAVPDGHTLLYSSNAIALSPGLYSKLGYDPWKDLAPITEIGNGCLIFVVHPSLPVKSVKDFLGIARAKPGEIFYSTAGRGTVGHLAAELLNSVAKIKLTAVHYKGTGPSMIDLVAGHVQMQFPSMPAAVQYTRPGKLRMIAQTGEKRSNAAGEVPTMQEQGLKGFVVSSGFAMFAPAGTPKPIIDRLNGAMVKALNDPAVKNNLAQQGAEVVASTPEAHDKFNRAEIAKWIKVAREAGIQPE